ncbi:MAG: hypothetical protein KDB18_07450 [Salinibacterium sp.]|nr:hypothetical protein [Salinibacterium sp.]
MSASAKFSTKVQSDLGSYVYLYIDPRNDKLFYVGKGRANRCFAHLRTDDGSEKAKILRELHATGKKPQIEILRYGLTDDEASLVESCVIDLLDLEKLTNKVRGKHWRRGPRGSVEDIRVTLEARPVTITDPVILINIAQLYRPGMSAPELYDSTRHAWKVNPDRHPAKHALAIHGGIVREVYQIACWFPAGTTYRTNDQHGERRHDADPTRFEFVGHLAEPEIRKRYLHKSVERYFKPGAQNPIKYIKC